MLHENWNMLFIVFTRLEDSVVFLLCVWVCVLVGVFRNLAKAGMYTTLAGGKI